MKPETLEEKTAPKIEGFEVISSEEFYKLRNEGLRLFDYSQDCKQYFYRKIE